MRETIIKYIFRCEHREENLDRWQPEDYVRREDLHAMDDETLLRTLLCVAISNIVYNIL